MRYSHIEDDRISFDSIELTVNPRISKTWTVSEFKKDLMLHEGFNVTLKNNWKKSMKPGRLSYCYAEDKITGYNGYVHKDWTSWISELTGKHKITHDFKIWFELESDRLLYILRWL